MSTTTPSSEPAPRAVLVGLFVAGLLVYGATLAARDVWAEECFWSYDRPWDVLTAFFMVDRWAGRPPLFYTLRSFSLAAFGVGPWGLRFFALVFGAAAVPATWLLARRVVDVRGAWVASLALLFGALPGYFARESHVYSLSILLCALLGGVALDVAQRRDVGRRGPGLVFVSLLSSLMLFPVAGILTLLAIGVALRAGPGAWSVTKRYGGAWLGAGVVYLATFISLRARGGHLLEMGGEDGDGGVFTENNPIPTLVRAVDGMAFGPNGPFLGTSLEDALPIATCLAVLALGVMRARGGWSVGALAVGSFLGGLAPFLILSWFFGHDHRLDARYFVHLAPLVAVAWAGAFRALPVGARGAGEGVLLLLLIWGSVRTQSPPNGGMRELVETVGARAEPGDRAVGAEDFFHIGISCLPPVPVPRVEDPAPADAPERLWVLRQKDEEDRFPASMRHELPPGFAEAGFHLAYERFVRPQIHEEFGQIVWLGRYDRGAEALSAEQVRFEVDLSAWPLAAHAERIRVFRLDHFPLRYRDDDAELVADVALERDGGTLAASVTLEPEFPYDWEIVVGASVPGVGDWPPALQQTPFTTYGLGGQAVIGRPPFHWDPILARIAVSSLLLLLPFLGAGVVISATRSLRGEGARD